MPDTKSSAPRSPLTWNSTEVWSASPNSGNDRKSSSNPSSSRPAFYSEDRRLAMIFEPSLSFQLQSAVMEIPWALFVTSVWLA